MTPPKTPRFPPSVDRKLYKTGQTRGATPAEIYQNRVGRNSTVLVPFSHWRQCQLPEGESYEKGSICLIAPEDYFADPKALAAQGLVLGETALVFYSRQADWRRWPPDVEGWVPAESRIPPLGGQFVARVPGTTGADGPVSLGFTTSQSRGAGIRVYEYATAEVTQLTRVQLEALMWRCHDALATFEAAGMSADEVAERAELNRERAAAEGLLDLDRLRTARAIDSAGHTVCPLCLERMSAHFFSDRVKQAAGRERLDTTITAASLFHIRELRVGELGHRPYNVGWGHHHCNVVATDAGISPTLDWMRSVLARNDAA